jgi:hypothetical protein
VLPKAGFHKTNRRRSQTEQLTRDEAILIRTVLLSEEAESKAELQASKLGVDLDKLLDKLYTIQSSSATWFVRVYRRLLGR